MNGSPPSPELAVILFEISLQLKQIQSSIQRNDGHFLEHFQELMDFVEKEMTGMEMSKDERLN